MKCKVLITAFALTLCSASAQTLDSLWNGYLSPFVQTGGTAPSFQFSGSFTSVVGFNGTQIDLADNPRLIVFNNNTCYELPITSITESGSIIAGTAVDHSGELSALPAGAAIIYNPSKGLGVAPFPAGVSEALKSCLQTATNLKMDSIQAGSGAVNSVNGYDGDVALDLTLMNDTLALSGDPTKVVLAPYRQFVDTLRLSGNTLEISIQGDNKPLKTVDLSSLSGGGGGNWEEEYFDSVTGSNFSTSGTLPVVDTTKRIIVYRTGVKLREGEDYSLSGNTVTLFIAADDEAFTIRYK